MREKKGELIAIMKKNGCSNKQIASIVYKDDTEEGQKKVRAMLSKMYMKELELKTGLKNHNLAEFLEFERMIINAINNKSLMSIIPILRKKKTLASGLLYRKFPVTMIAIILYGNYSKNTQNKVYAHISKFRKRIKELRWVVVANFPNKSCDLQNFSNPTANASFEPKNRNSWHRNRNHRTSSHGAHVLQQ